MADGGRFLQQHRYARFRQGAIIATPVVHGLLSRFLQAGTPYSRSVQQTHPLPQNQLPDPGLLFDT